MSSHLTGVSAFSSLFLPLVDADQCFQLNSSCTSPSRQQTQQLADPCTPNMSDKGDSVTEQVEGLRSKHDGGNGSGSGSGTGNGNGNVIDDDDTKVLAAQTEDVPAQTGAGSGVRRGLQPPEFLLNMSMEERLELEAKLKRKIDLRLMPAIILMYILNYIDRFVPHSLQFYTHFPAQRIHFPPDSNPIFSLPPTGSDENRCGPTNPPAPPASSQKKEMSPPN